MNRFHHFILLLLVSSMFMACNEEAKNEAQVEKELTAEQQKLKKERQAKRAKRKKNKKEPAKLIAPDGQKASAQAPRLPDTYPLYPGCTEKGYEARKRCANQKMVENVIKVMRYPQSAIDNNVNGTVVYTFIIEADGTMSDLRLEKSLTPDCDEAGRRAIEDLMKLSGPWEPGTLNGENQPVRYTLPLVFKNSPKEEG